MFNTKMFSKKKKQVRTFLFFFSSPSFYNCHPFIRCETEYKIIEDKIYREECKVDIQHICEEHVTVPVQVDVHNYPTNQHQISETYHNSYESPHSTHLLPPRHVHDSKDQIQRSQHGFTLTPLDTQLNQALNETTDPNYAYDPTPGSKFLISPRPRIYNHEISSSVSKTK